MGSGLEYNFSGMDGTTVNSPGGTLGPIYTTVTEKLLAVVARNTKYNNERLHNLEFMDLHMSTILVVILAVNCITAIACLWRAIKG